MNRSIIVVLGMLGFGAFGLTGLASAEAPVCIPGAAGRFDVIEDGDIDLDDHAILAACLSGPGETPQPPSHIDPDLCLKAFDVDGDGDVDLDDARWFFLRFTSTCRGIGDCPDGFHLVHHSGVDGVPNPDTFVRAEANATDFSCLPDESCDGVACSGNGACQILDGTAVCACNRGYAGADCERCAIGYDRSSLLICELGAECRERLCSGQGTCRDTGLDIVCECDLDVSGRFCEEGGGDPSTRRSPARVIIKGLDASVSVGECITLTAEGLGGGAIATDFVWKLTGPGLLSPTSGETVTYCAPSIANDTRIARFDICTGSFPNDCATRYLTIDPPGGIASTGNSHVVFEPVDNAVRTFMRHRCIGGAVLGISWFGKVVHLRGYGNLSGAPTDDPAYLEACCDTYDVSDHVPGFNLPAPSPVLPDTPMRIGSITKGVTGAILRKSVKEIVFGGPNATDAAVESARICETDLGLLPVDVRNILCFGAPGPPVPLPNEDDNATFCPNLTLAADSRWQDVTLGHFLGHATGLSRSAPDTMTTTIPNLSAIREYFGESDLIDDQDALTSQTGFPGGDFDAEFSDFFNASAAIDPAYFVPRPTVFEIFQVALGRCLTFTPGDQTQYSNTGFNVLSSIIEHITGKTYAARSGRPGLVIGSALHAFTTSELGLPFPWQLSPGIFYSSDVFRLRGLTEPIYRAWSKSQQTYYELLTDKKRPYCTWNGNTCDFTDFVEDNVRYDWDFHDAPQLLGYDNSPGDSTGGTGGLAAEPEAFLRFMAKYWVNGEHKSNPSYGQSRCPGGNCVWNKAKSHNGLRATAYAEAWQLGGTTKTSTPCASDAQCGNSTICADTPQEQAVPGLCLGGFCRKLNEYSIPALDPVTGFIGDDFSEFECNACALPVGVDFFIAVNQHEDCKCQRAQDLCEETPFRYTCDDAYGRLADFVLHGICQIDFPINPYVVWPTVFGGGSSMTVAAAPPEAELVFAPEEVYVPYVYRGVQLASAAEACCGNDVRDPGEECDGDDFGTQSCSSFGHNMGSLRCTVVCTIDAEGCTGGLGGPPPGYTTCGFSSCQDPSDPNCTLGGDAGRCVGGPCQQTDLSDYDLALIDPLNQSGGMFHPDGNFRDAATDTLFFCYDDTSEGEMVCIDEDGWGVCHPCSSASELSTLVGCTCIANSQCDTPGQDLTCYGEEYGGGPGFCYDTSAGPPAWQCIEGTCGMTTYPDDTMYCEHYSTNGQARCEPWATCNPILARVCAGQDDICGCFGNAGGTCDEGANACIDSSCCGPECAVDSDCSEQNGWPFGFSCSQQNNCVSP